MGNGKQFYFKSDGNGGVSISKTMIALITLIFLILSTASYVAARSSKLSTEVIQMKDDIIEMKLGLNDMNDYKLESSIQLATIINKLDNIEKKLEEI